MIATAIQETGDKAGMQVWPNPVSDAAKFVFPQEGAYLLQIYDLSGRMLHQEQVQGKSFLLPTGSFAGGLYFYRVSVSNQPAFCGKFMVVH